MWCLPSWGRPVLLFRDLLRLQSLYGTGIASYPRVSVPRSLYPIVSVPKSLYPIISGPSSMYPPIVFKPKSLYLWESWSSSLRLGREGRSLWSALSSSLSAVVECARCRAAVSVIHKTFSLTISSQFIVVFIIFFNCRQLFLTTGPHQYSARNK